MSSLYYLGAAGGITALLLLVALVASIVLFVKFATKKADHSKPLTRFFSFDHLFVESIMKFLYVLSATSIAAICVAMPIGALVVGRGNVFLAFLGALLGAIVLFFVLEFLNRVLFEWSMLFIRGAVDLHDIRNKMLGTTDQVAAEPSFDKFTAAAGASFEAAKTAFSKASESWKADASNQPAQPVEPARPAQPARPVEPAQPTQPISRVEPTWNCECGSLGNKGAFCGKCGRPRP